MHRIDRVVTGRAPQISPYYRGRSVSASSFSLQKDAAPQNIPQEIPMLNGLTAEQKDTIWQAWEELNQENPGRDLGAKRWERFLGSLQEAGILSEKECFLAGGMEMLMVAVPDPDENGMVTMLRQGIPGENEQIEMRDADPIQWLEYFIFYQSKISEVAKLDGYGTSGISEQIAACRKVQSIVAQFQG